ncbi:hypothetical protein BHO_0900077 (plasmid) [Borrelia hermsii YBT]|uniref:Uncharacterized protein n=1 Tax=Borrelia hermsii YBT TaxID=1313295 RepID=W5T2C3_BORHE|nr:hypothetical protein BHO_0900077 [Borrelia hermsii YBT]
MVRVTIKVNNWLTKRRQLNFIRVKASLQNEELLK